MWYWGKGAGKEPGEYFAVTNLVTFTCHQVLVGRTYKKAMRLSEYEALVGELRNAYKVSVGKS